MLEEVRALLIQLGHTVSIYMCVCVCVCVRVRVSE